MGDFDPRRVNYQESSLSGLHYSGQQVRHDSHALEEQTLLRHMQQSMQRNIEVQGYANAIFSADKVVNLLTAREHSASHFTSQGLPAAPAGRMEDSLHQSKLSKKEAKLSAAGASAIYDLAYCYLLNGEHLRCVELLENHDLVYSSLKFRTPACCPP